MANLISYRESYFPHDLTWQPLSDNETFQSLKAPVFECATFERSTIIDWDEVLNTEGTVLSPDADDANKARAGGITTNNVAGIQATLKDGYDPKETPPILVRQKDGSLQLWDGYNRYKVCCQLDLPCFPVYIYKLNEDWYGKEDDAYDIVALGANLHLASYKHTKQDFVLRGQKWVKRQGNNCSTREITDWVNTIPHSWNEKQVGEIVNKIYTKTTLSVNIKPFISGSAAKKVAHDIYDIDEQEKHASRNPIVVCAKEKDYVVDAYIKILNNFVGDDDHDPIDDSDVIFYTKGCESAAEVKAQRKEAVEQLEHLDKLVVSYVTKRLINNGKLPYHIAGYLPQLIGTETLQENELVPHKDS